MRLCRFRVLAITSILLLSSALVCGSAGGGYAQTKAADDESGAVDQISLTDKQIEGLIAAQKEIADITSKIPEAERDAPNPKIQARLEGIAKKNGFADFSAYDAVATNIGLVLSGFDPETKQYVGSEAVIKKQIADVKADKQMPAKDKKDALDQLNASLKAVTPIKYPDNIKLVGKYYDKLSEVMQQD